MSFFWQVLLHREPPPVVVDNSRVLQFDHQVRGLLEESRAENEKLLARLKQLQAKVDEKQARPSDVCEAVMSVKVFM